MTALRDPRFQRLLAGQSLSSFGDSALYLSLAIWAKDLTGSNRPHALTGRAPHRDLLPLAETQTSTLQITTPPRPHAAGLNQHTTTSAAAGVDHLHRIADEATLSHHLPELLQKIRTDKDRIRTHRTTPNH